MAASLARTTLVKFPHENSVLLAEAIFCDHQGNVESSRALREMTRMPRRAFLKSSIMGGLALGMPAIVRGGSPNDTVRMAIIGLGDTQAVGAVGGRGHQLIPHVRAVPGVKIAGLCDVDPSFIAREAQAFKDRGEEVAAWTDLRRVLDEKDIDAVVVATPNHWHALATVWACQAGKDVYVEKPFSYDIWEGKQAVAAARKYNRMVQVGMQNRSSALMASIEDGIRRLGPIRYVHALVYRPRTSIGRVTAPTPVPERIDYDLWCGPAPKGPLMRKQLNYEWHWFWDTGNGEIGNNGIHIIDLCRWLMGQEHPAPRALSIGGRFAFEDCGETPNTQIALFDYHPAPLICEIRNVKAGSSPQGIGKYRGLQSGMIVDCEGGCFAGDATGGTFFDKQGKEINAIKPAYFGNAEALVTPHLANFIQAVRSRKSDVLSAESVIGYRSVVCCHMANTSHRLGQREKAEAIAESIRGSSELSDAFERCRAYLRENDVDLNATPAALGPWLTFDVQKEHFIGDFAEQANAMARRPYRTPYVMPEIAV
jgi:predicted dehydrogenase